MPLTPHSHYLLQFNANENVAESNALTSIKSFCGQRNNEIEFLFQIDTGLDSIFLTLYENRDIFLKITRTKILNQNKNISSLGRYSNVHFEIML